MNNNTPHNQSTEKDFSEKVLARIEREKIAPRSRWYFVSHNILLWITGIVSLVLGAGVFAIVLFRIIHTDFYAYTLAGDTPVQFVMEWVPVLWFIFFAVFVYAGYRYFQKTDHGYKYPVWVISIVVCAASIVLGAVVYSVGVVPRIEGALERHVPGYRSFERVRTERMVRPHRGHIAGEVLWVNSTEQLFALNDFTGKEWRITFDLLTPEERVLLVPSTTIRVMGAPAPRDLQIEGDVLYMRACFVSNVDRKIRDVRYVGLGTDSEIIRREVRERKFQDERITLCRDMMSKKFLQKNLE